MKRLIAIIALGLLGLFLLGAVRIASADGPRCDPQPNGGCVCTGLASKAGPSYSGPGSVFKAPGR